MKHNFISLALLAASLFGTAGVAMAGTNITVVLKNGGQNVVAVDETGIIYFADNKMIVLPTSQATADQQYMLADIKKVLFGDKASSPRVLAENEMALYPTVAETEVFLANVPANGVVAQIYDVSGAKVAEMNVSNGQPINVSGLTSGAYLLVANGSTFKFVKK